MSNVITSIRRIRKKEVKIVIGARSAIFAPLKNLGVIIIDEEHESSYKSETTPKYHAREVAKKRCDMSAASLVLGSATPSVESYYKAVQGRYQLLELSERIGDADLEKAIVPCLVVH